MRLIDADALKAHYSWWSDENEYKKIFDDIVDAQPTVTFEDVKKFKKDEIEEYWSYELKDDNTPHGGIAFKGETLADWLEEDGREFNSLDEINRELQSCGIRPIVRKEAS